MKITLCCGYKWKDKNPLRLKGTGAECSKCGAAYLLREEEELVEVLYNQALQAAKNRGFSYFKTMHFLETTDARNTKEVAVIEMAIGDRWGRWRGDTIEDALKAFIEDGPECGNGLPEWHKINEPEPESKKASSFL